MITPYKTERSKKEQVEDMFDNIAPKYDRLNQLLSFGIHKRWRKHAIDLLLNKKNTQLLDIATGTGDLAIEAMRLSPEKVTGLDLSENMLKVGRLKIKSRNLENKIELIHGDSENLPFENEAFDSATVAFGVRNFGNLEAGLKEIHRVLKTNGTFVVLEFSKPGNRFLGATYKMYFHFILPLIGKMISADSRAYSYLPESVESFPHGKAFAEILEKSGFRDVRVIPLTFGVASLYTGTK
jgi:demethylmenaquinone methyltransferase / 2-methoxy-6-polyprenyl-1,4-benzoquinol methylase